MNQILSLNWQIFEGINQSATAQSLLGQLMIIGANDVVFLAPLLLLVLWLSLSPLVMGAGARNAPAGSFAAQLRAQGQRFALLGCLAVVLGIILSQVIGQLLYEPRPFVSHPGVVHQLVPHPADTAFPSDHETVMAAVATVLVLYLLTVVLPLRRMAAARPPALDAALGAVLGPAVAIATTLAVLGLLAVVYIGVSRVYVGVHYPGDIAGGAATGAIAGGVASAARPIAEPVLSPLIRVAQRFRLA